MNLLDKIFGREPPQKIIDKSPCLAPWYFGKDNPRLIKEDKILHWTSIRPGITALTDEDGNCFALLSRYCYVFPSDDNKSFLIWDRSLEKAIGFQSVRIFYYELDKLQPIDNRDKTISQMEKDKR